MEEKSMTALIGAFARAYHSQRSGAKVHDDPAAMNILAPEEFAGISEHMAGGISFFHPGFEGTPQEGLRWIVENQLAPSVLGRAAFAEQALKEAVATGAEQYVILAAGYDTFAWRRPAWADGLQIFEVDRPAMIRDKQRRAEHFLGGVLQGLSFVASDFQRERPLQNLENAAGYQKDKLTFFSLLGISYYLSQDDFTGLLREVARVAPAGSYAVFDYPDENTYTEMAGERAKRQVAMAAGAQEQMLASYSCEQMEALLSACGFAICEYLLPDDITNRFFQAYNRENPAHPITAFDNVNYCLARLK